MGKVAVAADMLKKNRNKTGEPVMGMHDIRVPA